MTAKKKLKKKKPRNYNRNIKNFKTYKDKKPENMKMHESDPTPSGTMYIWESEVQVMAGIANDWGDIETGGEMYGLLTPHGEVVVLYVIPPSPDAIHQKAHFSQSIQFLRKTNVFLRDSYILFYIGPFHSHHSLGLKQPSPGDIKSTRTIATKNGYKRIWQTILTFNGDSACNNKHYGYLKKGAKYLYNLKNRKEKNPYFQKQKNINRQIEIHAFCHSEQSGWGPESLTIEIIPGMSPLRRDITMAMYSNPLIPELCTPYSFPIDQIITQSSKSKHSKRKNDKILPNHIQKSLQTLPLSVQKETQIDFKDDLIIIILPIPDQKAKVFIATNKTPPHKTVAVYLSGNGTDNSPVDHTEKILSSNPYPKLLDVYESAKTIHLNTVKAIVYSSQEYPVINKYI